jgi:hypothetical protein
MTMSKQLATRLMVALIVLNSLVTLVVTSRLRYLLWAIIMAGVSVLATIAFWPEQQDR